ncbi:AAA family ATPase [Acinetobacter sp. PFS20]|uniref:AAA family ATPase n=1 Tax=Acinetobacter sp. PFS20 TaxID=3458434 RepID=UPI003FD4A6DE
MLAIERVKIKKLFKKGMIFMKIQKLEIVNIGGIEKLTLDNFDPQMNIICGPNGIGKTTIIDSIAHIFVESSSTFLKRNVNADSGEIKYKIEIDEENIYENLFKVDVYKPHESTYLQGLMRQAKKFLFLKTNREFTYTYLSHLGKGEEINDRQASHKSISGIDSQETKNWFIFQNLRSYKPDELTPEEIHNYKLATDCFSFLNKKYTFHAVDSKSMEILINTPNGIIIYEYLSSGFKSIICIIWGIIKELEYRFKELPINASEFDGIIVIDEIELHLHPEWQGEICKVLKKSFPNAQFILTTHSPHVIQTALKGEVIALERDGNDVKQRDLVDQEFGYLGWTIEEILEDIMGMPDLRTKKYNDVKKRFDNALDKKDKEKALEAYKELDKLLHPNYPLRPVFKIQLDSLGE